MQFAICECPCYNNDRNGWLAQLVRARGSHPRGHRFDSYTAHSRATEPRRASRGSLVNWSKRLVDPTYSVVATPSTRVDSSLFRLRWVVGLGIFPVAWITAGNQPLTTPLISWFIVLAIVNLAYGTVLRFAPRIAKWLPVPSLILDIILFGTLPYFFAKPTPLLEFFALFPAFIGAVRFGPKVGFITAGGLTLLLLGNRSLADGSLIPREINSLILPVVGLFGGVVILGFLTKQEKEVAAKQAAMELDELRGVIAGAKLLYQTSDMFTLTTSYRPVLESMLDAGVRGLPEARREDGPSVGIAMFFDDQDPDKRLRVVAARNLDKADQDRLIPAHAGIVAEALRTGNVSVTEQVHHDPELSEFTTLASRRCAVCYPLQSGLEQYGVVILASPAPRRPSQQHLDLMRAFTSQAGIAFQNARLYQITRKEQDRIIRSDTEVRAKLARDLHDGPTQKVSGLVMQLEFITRLLDTDMPEAKRELEKARATAQQTVKEIRTALFTLRPLALESKGLSTALSQYGERLRETENVPITIEPGDFSAELEMNTAATIFAVIEEAVGNARKHANNTPIYVRVTRQGHTLVATIQDQGPGFDVHRVTSSYERRGSLGLQNMRERAMLINGELRIDSAPGQGTRITLVVPLTSANPFERPL